MSDLDAKAKKAAYDRKYYALPEVRAKKDAAQRTPTAKAKRVAYNNRPEVKAKQAAYHSQPEVKAKNFEYNARPEVKAARAASKRQHNSLPEVKSKRTENVRKRYAIDTQFRLEVLLRSRLRDALKNKQKRGSAVRLLGCTIEELITHLETKFSVGMSWESRGAWHIDHIIPLSSFDLEDFEQLKIACHYTNLQPLWAFDNISKGSKVTQ
jgi:5-methylcytosine-specific restriction endonuclease McrA